MSKKTELLPLWQRIALFIVWPVFAPIFLIIIAALFIVCWPVILFCATKTLIKDD